MLSWFRIGSRVAVFGERTRGSGEVRSPFLASGNRVVADGAASAAIDALLGTPRASGACFREGSVPPDAAAARGVGIDATDFGRRGVACEAATDRRPHDRVIASQRGGCRTPDRFLRLALRRNCALTIFGWPQLLREWSGRCFEASVPAAFQRSAWRWAGASLSSRGSTGSVQATPSRTGGTAPQAP